jgi:MoaA/NifB/PqqE/SkfB family radical SAM enzyme
MIAEKNNTRQMVKRILVQIPSVRRYLAEKHELASAIEALKDKDTEQRAMIAALNAERASLNAERASPLPPVDVPKSSAIDELLAIVASGDDLKSVAVHALTEQVESLLAKPGSDKLGVHREIGKALFARSQELYSGQDLPHYLVRYTYPAFLSIALNSHCNAACFFCRKSDYKGDTVEFDNVFKLASAVRNARAVDLTGWGEPFFYPRFEEVVEFIGRVNPLPHNIQVTTNGSFLSKKWGKMLSGKLHRMVISINAGTEQTYASQMQYKNKRFTFSETVASIQEFMEELTQRDRDSMILHMVANSDNFREIKDVVALADRLGVKVVSVGNYICAQPEHVDKTLWNVKKEYNQELLTAREMAAERKIGVWGRSFFVAEEEVKGPERCMAPFEECFVEMPGTLTPCCFMGNVRMGNVYADGFEKVWFSDIMNKLRVKRDLPPCRVCTVFSPFDRKTSHISAMKPVPAEQTAMETAQQA